MKKSRLTSPLCLALLVGLSTSQAQPAPAEDPLSSIAQRQAQIKTHYGDDQRPLWQTDLVEQQLIEYLQVNQADATDFYEFGVPTAAQRRAFESTVPQALEEISDADLRLAQEQDDLPRQPDHVAKRVSTGLWDRMMNQYYKLRVPYFQAHAAFYTALMPSSNPYYLHLDNPHIPNQMKTPAQERCRLLALAAAKLDQLTRDPDAPAALRRPVLCLTARVLIAQGKWDQAMALLGPMIRDAGHDRTNLLERLAEARALAATGDQSAALSVLADAQGLALVKGTLLFRLLVTDATHLVLLDRARASTVADRVAALSSAYEPYLKLLDDPTLGASAGSLQTLVYRRWEENIQPTQDVSDLPARVVAGISEISLARGQSLMDNAAKETNQDHASQFREQGRVKLTRAVDLSMALLKRPDLTPDVKAQAMFSEGVAMYYLGSHDRSRAIGAAVVLTDLADQLPDQKQAEPAIIDAVGILHELKENLPHQADVADAYRRAADVLISKYPATKAALDERLYYADQVLVPAGQLDRVIEVVGPIPPDHPDYFLAQRLLLDCLEQQYRQARAAQANPAAAATGTIAMADPDALAAGLETNASRIYAQAQRAQPQATGKQAEAVRYAAGWSRLVLAEMAMERHQDPAQVLALLKDFDREYAGHSDLIRLMLERRIDALFKLGRMDDAVGEANHMMDAFPDDAAPVVDRVLTGLDEHREALALQEARAADNRQRNGLRAQTDAIAVQEAKLSGYLLGWAMKQKYDLAKRLPIQIIYAKSLRLSGAPQQALDVLTPLLPGNPSNADIIFNAAEAWFALANDQDLIEKAGPLYDRLINGIPAENGKYPVLWWTAWMRRLQISDITRLGADQISLRIRQLRLTDPGLGGDTTRPTLEALARTWGQ